MKAGAVGVSVLFLTVLACEREGSRPVIAPQESALPEQRHETPPSAPSTSAVTVPTTGECGELAMKRVGLIEEGLGGQHPNVVSVDTLLAQCADKTPSPEACLRVAKELTETTAGGYGPNHPKVRSLTAQQALCPK